MAHLDLSYCKQLTDECATLIGHLFWKTMVSLQLRSCHALTDEGIIGMCEGFSRAAKHRKIYKEPKNDDERYKEIIKLDMKSYLGYLNVGDIKNLSDRAMRSIAINLMSSLIDLCIWGNYKITNNGILELCCVSQDCKFRRINHCGCYKVSDDSKIWFMTSFKSCVINYIRVEEFGAEIDYKSSVVLDDEDREADNELDYADLKEEKEN